jgi:hypothetical protein
MFNARQFAQRLANRQDCWSLLKESVAEWHTPLKDGDGYAAEEIDQAEQRLGLRLPIALREWYSLAGRRDDITRRQYWLRRPSELTIRGDVLEFHRENQSVVNWGVRLTDFDQDDPPVFIDDVEYLGRRRNHRVVQNSSLSEFALQMVVLETMLSARFRADADCQTNTQEIIASNFHALGFPDWAWPGAVTRWYGGSDVLVQITCDEAPSPSLLSIAARNDDAYRRSLKLFDADWMHLGTESCRKL